MAIMVLRFEGATILESNIRYVDGLKFVMTCDICPEQYDAYKDNEKVGYVRLRWWELTCECPDVDGELVYDEWHDGFWCFESEEDRMKHLREIAQAINQWLERQADKG